METKNKSVPFFAEYDLIVGIPSYNEADTISYVVDVVSAGLSEYFPDKNCIIVNVDNSSPDNTKEAFLNTDIPHDKKYISTKNGICGKGNNFLNLFNFVAGTKAEAVIVLDADLRSVTKEWVKYLAEPIFKGYDYVTPLYSRHQFDGTLTNHICYPVMFGLLSVDIRQPIGGEFAFSTKFMRYLLTKPWTEAVKHYGVDIFMTLNAVLGGFKVCQSGLGTKIHKASAPKLGIMFEQVVEALLNVLVENKEFWDGRSMNDCVVPDRFGFESLGQPQELEIDFRELKLQCQNAYKENFDAIKELLDAFAFLRVREMMDMDFYDLDVLLWTQIFYKLLFKYDTASGVKERRAIIDVLKPLYLARSLSYDYNTWKYNVKYAEMETRNQALVFASQKYYLWGLYSRLATD